MKNTILQFGLLALLLALLAQLARYSFIWHDGSGRELTLAAFAAGCLFAGFLLRKWLQKPATPNAPADSPTPFFQKIKTGKAAQIGISERESEVLELLAAGLSNLEIGQKLFISESTVKTHVSNLLQKLEARRRTEAVRRARELGLI